MIFLFNWRLIVKNIFIIILVFLFSKEILLAAESDDVQEQQISEDSTMSLQPIIEKFYVEKVDLKQHQSVEDFKGTYNDVAQRIILFARLFNHAYFSKFKYKNLFDSIGLEFFLKESIKNSYDAKLAAYYLAGDKRYDVLELGITVAIDGDEVIVKLEDNCGGFEYIPVQVKLKYSNTYLAHSRFTSKKNSDEGYFGSMGFGLLWAYESFARNQFELWIQNTGGGSILEVRGTLPKT